MSEQLHHLSIDLETYSTVSIGAAGSYRYILDPSFEILLFAYSLDGMPVEVIDVASGQIIPLWLKNALKNPLYIKHAYNAAFEWFALSKYLGWLPPPISGAIRCSTRSTAATRHLWTRRAGRWACPKIRKS